jgi:hypothetical protein
MWRKEQRDANPPRGTGTWRKQQNKSLTVVTYMCTNSTL